MIKKFFVAMILGLLVMSSQIVTAAETINWKSIDWNSAPRIGSKYDFSRYIESERRKDNTTFYIVLTNGLKVYTVEDFANLAPVAYLKYVCDETTHECFFNIIEYPGTRVANAYLSRQPDIAWKNLDYEERLLYSEALPIVNEANKRSSEVEKARCIHKAICERKIEAVSGEGKINIDSDGKLKTLVTAFGALINKKANCQGFSDSFYMLGRMCGLSVGKIRGKMRGDNHQWNTIKLNGKIYFVDVTQDYVNNTDKFFMKDLETMRNKYSYEWEIIPNLQ